jgi:hypothetical protein
MTLGQIKRSQFTQTLTVNVEFPKKSGQANIFVSETGEFYVLKEEQKNLRVS